MRALGATVVSWGRAIVALLSMRVRCAFRLVLHLSNKAGGRFAASPDPAIAVGQCCEPCQLSLPGSLQQQSWGKVAGSLSAALLPCPDALLPVSPATGLGEGLPL